MSKRKSPVVVKQEEPDLELKTDAPETTTTTSTTTGIKRRRVNTIERKNTTALSVPGHGSVPVDSYEALLKRASTTSILSSTTTTSLPPLPSVDDDDDEKVKEEEDDEKQATKSSKRTRKKKKERVLTSVDSRYDTRVDRVSVAPFAALTTKPYELEAGKELLSSMRLVSMHIPDSQNNQLPKMAVEDLLAQKLVVIDLIEAHYADMLLYESGNWPALYYNNKTKKWIPDGTLMRDYPPCDYGEKCVCMTQGFESLDGRIPPGFICTQIIFSREYAKLLDTNTKPPARPCILCARHKSGLFVPFVRSTVRDKSMNTTSTVTVEPKFDETESFQLFREIKDADEGYIGRYMSVPHQGVWEGYIDPICKLNHDQLIACGGSSSDSTTTTRSRRYIDQSLLKFKVEEKIEPNIGEQLSRF